MEAVLIIAALAWAGYKLVKFNTAAGAEAVRALIFLEGLKRGETVDRANEVVDIDLLDTDPDKLRQVTETIQTVHGKQLPLMAEAYRRGMHPKIPKWYYNFASKTPASTSVRREYPAKSMGAEDTAADSNTFLLKINEHSASLGIDLNASSGAKISAFLMFGARLARSCAELPPIDDKTSIIECAALLMFTQQGIHTLLTARDGPYATREDVGKEEFSRIFTFVTSKIFNFDIDSPGDRGLGIMSLGTVVTKNAQSSNVYLLQSIFDAWDALFNNIGDDEAVRMGKLYSEAIQWARISAP